MKQLWRILAVAGAVAGAAGLGAGSVFAQGSFQNLDFELAVISPPPADYTPIGYYDPISAADALPYWTARMDNTVCTAVEGSITIDVTSVAIMSSNWPNSSFSLDDAYWVQISGDNLIPGYYTSASISQTGLVPNGAESIQFLMLNFYNPYGPFEGISVTLNGTRIPVSVISTSGLAVTMAGDVSAFAGSVAELKFTAPAVSSYFLDSISFSSNPVPEPSLFSLIGLGLLGVGWFRQRNLRA